MKRDVYKRQPHAGSNRECAKAVKYLILAVKPQYFDAVFSEIRDVVTPEQVVISLAPGVTISNITERLGGNVRVVRAMPNTPAMLGEGMTGVSYGEASYTEEEKETIRDIFSSCGRVEPVSYTHLRTMPLFPCSFSQARVSSPFFFKSSREAASSCQRCV